MNVKLYHLQNAMHFLIKIFQTRFKETFIVFNHSLLLSKNKLHE